MIDKIAQILLALIEIWERHKAKKHEKKRKQAKSDPVNYFNSLDGMHDDKQKDDPDSTKS